MGAFFLIARGALNSILAPFYALELAQTEDLIYFFKAFLNSSQHLIHLEKALIRSTYSTPGSIVIVPRNFHRLRVLFYETFGIDVRFLAKSLMTVEGTWPSFSTLPISLNGMPSVDAFSDLKDPSTSVRLKKIPKLAEFFTWLEERLAEQIKKSPQFIAMQQGDPQRRLISEQIGFTSYKGAIFSSS